MTALNLFAQFLADKNANVMRITGSAGTGKTTLLKHIVDDLYERHIPCVTLAFTHKAKDIIKSKINEGADVRTLHSFLRLRPGLNENALKAQYLKVTTQFGEPEPIAFVIIDEFSMVNQDDFQRLLDLEVKLLFLGDPNQLEAVSGVSAKIDGGRYNYHLTHIYRQEGNSGLLDPLLSLVDMIENDKQYYLEPTDKFIREADIIDTYINSESSDKVMLAFTNGRVEALNAQLQQRLHSEHLWSPSLRQRLLPLYDLLTKQVKSIEPIMGVKVLLGTKWKTLEQLIYLSDRHNINFGIFMDEDKVITTRAYVHGHGTFSKLMRTLNTEVTEANKAISKITELTPKEWAQKNYRHAFARRRAAAWRALLTIDGNVICVDYPFCTTVHKSQGSTYEEVFLDGEDIARCSNLVQMKKLLYVGISRASSKVYTNN